MKKSCSGVNWFNPGNFSRLCRRSVQTIGKLIQNHRSMIYYPFRSFPIFFAGQRVNSGYFGIAIWFSPNFLNRTFSSSNKTAILLRLHRILMWFLKTSISFSHFLTLVIEFESTCDNNQLILKNSILVFVSRRL